MNPRNDQPNAQVGMPRNDQPTGFHVVAPARQQSAPQHAAADLIRGQLDNIYSGNSGENTPHTTPVAVPTPQANPATPQQPVNPTPNPTPSVTPTSAETSSAHGFNTAPPEGLPEKAETTDAQTSTQPTSAYDRTMSNNIANRQPSKEDWQQYHSAWQKYYQMYYERTYQARSNAVTQPAVGQPDKASQADGEVAESSQSMSQKQAMHELRNSIRQKVAASAEKARKSRNFVPIIAGLVVLLVFVGIQYNRQIVGAVMAYSSPGSTEPGRIITNPNTETEVGPEPMMIIPKTNVEAPVVYGIGPDHNSQMKAMENGIAHFSIPGANAVPGQVGNAVFAAHSSNDAFARGDYKFVFMHNERLAKDDLIYMNYEGTRYTYSVKSLEVVLPSEVSKVQIDTDKPMITLISCVPLGTAEKRLLVFAEQISPSTSTAKAAEDNSSAPDADSIPGQPAPTLLEKLFGIN